MKKKKEEEEEEEEEKEREKKTSWQSQVLKAARKLMASVVGNNEKER